MSLRRGTRVVASAVRRRLTGRGRVVMRLRRLPAGTYRLVVRARERDGTAIKVSRALRVRR